MDKDIKFLLDRIDRLRDELREDMSSLVSGEARERKALDERVRKVEKTINVATGGSLIMSVLAPWLFNKLGR